MKTQRTFIFLIGLALLLAAGAGTVAAQSPTPGIELVKDFTEEGGTLLFSPVLMDGVLYFGAAAIEAVEEGGHAVSLWRTDGTSDGTQKIADFEISSVHDWQMVAVESTLFFAAKDNEYGDELWKSDGTPAGTGIVADICPGDDYAGRCDSNPSGLTAWNGVLYFTAHDGVHGFELWRSDGTPAGTGLLKDIKTGNEHSYSAPGTFTPLNDRLFFSADDGVHGRELWLTDGTADGTQLVTDINPTTGLYGDPNGAYPSEMTAFNGRLFFTAADGLHGSELWISDGTADGTAMVRDINAGGVYSDSYPEWMVPLDGQLYFAADDETHGRELWKTDGTAEGTQLVAEVCSETGDELCGSYPQELVVMGGRLFFAAANRLTGPELWVSDGDTVELVKDIYPGMGPSVPETYGLTVFQDMLYFFAYDGVHGIELWRSDGTTRGTKLVVNLNLDEEVQMPFPRILAVVGDRLLFHAGDGSHGFELWRYQPPTEWLVYLPVIGR